MPSNACGMVLLRSGRADDGCAAADVADRSDALRRGRRLDAVLNGDRVVDRVEAAVLVEADLRALDPGQGDGVLGVVRRAVEGVHGAAWLVEVGPGHLGLVGVLPVQPPA